MIDETGVLTYQGLAVKALGNGKIGGQLVLFSTEHDPDLAGEYFTPETDFDFEDGDRTTILYHHGLDPHIKGRSLGKGKLSHNDLGVWVEAQLDLRDEYEKSIYDLAEQGKLGWSSGTASHRVEKQQTGKATWIKSWALGLDASLTPTPCEPRTRAIPLKALMEPKGQTLAEQTDHLITQADAYASRIKGYIDLKAKDNRKVGKEKRDQIETIKSILQIILDEIDAPDKMQAMKMRLLREKFKN